MKVSFGPVKIDGLIEYIKSLPRGVKVTAMRAFMTYIIGNKQHGLRHEPAYKYVSRKAAGYAPMSDKMRRWFWANGGPDMIGNNRTGAISEGWTMKETNDWTHVTVSNKAPGVGWVMGLKQARQPAKVGWRQYAEVIESNFAGAMKAAQSAVSEFLRSRGKV